MAAKALAKNAGATPAPKSLPTTVYAGASTIDLERETITLGDGTEIDLHTGARLDVLT